ncbi:MAG: ATP-binding cassette domain-containing protein [Geminicoccaceae bacterium]|nr:ATP-binding cassette domain-containing protein [Geminicoccaceae bacterium]
MTDTPALAVENLSFAYGRRKALDKVTIGVPKGSFTALLGPNGAGKTTLMALATGLFHSRQGRINVCGHDLRSEPRKALAAMGVVFQQPTLDQDLTVRQNMRYAAALHGLGGRGAGARIDAALDRLGLADRQGDTVRALSGGLRRRVEIARALLHRPRLLILDEATVGLDVDSRHGIVETVHRLCAEAGVAVLWATHLIDEVRQGDRVVVLHEGRVRAAGTLDEVLRTIEAAGLAEAWTLLTRTEAP